MKAAANRAMPREVVTPEAREIFDGPRLVNDIMSVTPISLRPEHNFYDVVTLMGSRSVRHALVVDGDDHLVGVVSDRDVLRALSHTADWSGKSVSEIMTSEPVTVSGETAISTAAALMIAKRVNCLPVVDKDKRVCGILTSSDLMKAYGKLQELIEKVVS